MVNIGKLASKVFSLLKGNGYQVKLYDVLGNETVDPASARRMFVINQGLMVTLDEELNELQLSKGVASGFEDTLDLQRVLRQFANEFLMNYTVKEFNKSIQPRDFSYQAKIQRTKGMENVAEASLSKLTGSKKTSHQTLENVKILVKHRQAVDEERRGARSRNIQAIFLERDGERFRFPCNHLGGARAMARHMYGGGSMNDVVGEHIVEKTQQLGKLKEFYRYVKSNGLINEDSNDAVDTIIENIQAITGDLKRLAGTKTYESISARIQASSELDLVEDDNVASLRDVFTVRRFDERYDDVLPLVNRLINEKNGLLNRIEEASGTPIMLSPMTSGISNILEFSSENSRLGSQLSELAARIQENSELSSYLSNIGKKLCQEQELSAFESHIVRNSLSNVACQQLEESKSDKIDESESFERFFDRYTYLYS